jgi:hypothetical protein
MNRENAHIETYLDYYCSLDNSPGFSIMLSGISGVGKTWLITQYRKKMEREGLKVLYLSLFGIDSFAEIENSFFEQLHPALSKRGMGLSARILKDAIKSSINLQVDKDKVTEYKPEDWHIPSYLANSKDCIVVLDDIDRCYLPVPEIFGFINFLLEHHGFRVILIADEDALAARQDNAHIESLSYQLIKDKVVGRTFVVEPDFDEAYGIAVERIENPDTIAFMKSSVEIVRNIFSIATNANLRHLQYAVLDFERLFSKLPPECHAKKDFLKHLLAVFMVFSFELRSHNIQPTDLNGIRLTFHSRLFAKETFEEKKSPQTYLLNKYKKFRIQDTVLSEEWWVNYFDKGIIETEDILEDLKVSHWFFSKDTPAILRAAQIWELEDNDFSVILRQVQIEFNAQKYVDPCEIVLAVSFLLWASEQGLLKKEKSAILKEAEELIDVMIKNNSLEAVNHSAIAESNRQTWCGVPFFTVDMPEFKEFCRYIDQICKAKLQEEIARETRQILEIMKNDTDRFCSIITFPRKDDKAFHDIPILSYMSAEEFFKTFMTLTPEQRLLVGQSLQERYFMEKSSHRIVPEANWLKNLIDLIYAKADETRGSLSNFTLKTIADKLLSPSLERVETIMMGRRE